MIRVGAGTAKGRLLKAPKGERPTLGRVKQTLFDMLAGRLEGAAFLDVFAGGGIVGIEALSRGARAATFIEAKARNAALVRENLATCGFGAMSRVVCAEARRALLRLAGEGASFQIVFLDPPYNDPRALAGALGALAEANSLLSPEGMIIVQRAGRRPIADLPGSLELYDSRKIGDSALDFLRRKLT